MTHGACVKVHIHRRVVIWWVINSLSTLLLNKLMHDLRVLSLLNIYCLGHFVDKPRIAIYECVILISFLVCILWEEVCDMALWFRTIQYQAFRYCMLCMNTPFKPSLRWVYTSHGWEGGQLLNLPALSNPAGNIIYAIIVWNRNLWHL